MPLIRFYVQNGLIEAIFDVTYERLTQTFTAAFSDVSSGLSYVLAARRGSDDYADIDTYSDFPQDVTRSELDTALGITTAIGDKIDFRLQVKAGSLLLVTYFALQVEIIEATAVVYDALGNALLDANAATVYAAS